MFWYVAGVGYMDRPEFESWSSMVKAGRRIVPPPYWESDTPFRVLPDLPQEVEDLALTFMAQALFTTLRASGHLRRIESKAPDMDKLVRSARELLAEKTATLM